MAADYHAHVYEPPGARHALLRNVPREVLLDLCIPAQWSPIQRGFVVRSERIADVVASLEYGNVRVRHHASEPKR